MTDETCKHCGGAIAIRNPSGSCDHLYWPDQLTDEAKLANGFKPVEQRTIVWMKENVTKEEIRPAYDLNPTDPAHGGKVF